MQDIVRESGLSKGTLYWYFPSKRDLFFALFDSIVVEMVKPFETLLTDDGSVADRLRMMSSLAAAMVTQDRELLALPLNFLVEVWQDPEFVAHYRAMLEGFGLQFEYMLTQGVASGEIKAVDTHALAWGILALIDGVFLYYLTGLLSNPHTYMEAVLDRVIDGVKV